MWEEILKLAIGNGLWAVLFCLLLFHILKDGKKREEKYVETISALAEKLKIVTDIKSDTEKIIKQTAKRATKTVSEAVAVANAS